MAIHFFHGDMMFKVIHLKGAFVAQTAEGRAFIINQFEKQPDMGERTGASSVVQFLQTHQGYGVNRIAKGVYQIPALDDLEVRASDAEAP